MARAKKTTIDGVEFDSISEACFYCWCREAKELGVIHDFELQPHFDLIEPVYYWPPGKSKAKSNRRTLLQGAGYTADFMISTRSDNLSLFSPNNSVDISWLDGLREYFVDVKGDSSVKGSAAMFSVMQKLTYKEHGIYVNKVICGADERHCSKKVYGNRFFAKNGMPRRLPEVCYQKSDNSKLYAVWERQFRGCAFIDEAWK